MFLNGINDFISLPQGLDELLEDITREVLRLQPTDLFQFIAEYLEALLSTREKIKVAHSILCQLKAQLNPDEMKNLLTLIRSDLEECNDDNFKLITSNISDSSLLFKMILKNLPRPKKLNGLSAAINTMRLYQNKRISI